MEFNLISSGFPPPAALCDNAWEGAFLRSSVLRLLPLLQSPRLLRHDLVPSAVANAFRTASDFALRATTDKMADKRDDPSSSRGLRRGRQGWIPDPRFAQPGMMALPLDAGPWTLNSRTVVLAIVVRG